MLHKNLTPRLLTQVPHSLWILPSQYVLCSATPNLWHLLRRAYDVRSDLRTVLSGGGVTPPCFAYCIWSKLHYPYHFVRSGFSLCVLAPFMDVPLFLETGPASCMFFTARLTLGFLRASQNNVYDSYWTELATLPLDAATLLGLVIRIYVHCKAVDRTC